MIDPHLFNTIKKRARMIEEITRNNVKLNNQMLAIIRGMLCEQDAALADRVRGDKADPSVAQARETANNAAKEILAEFQKGDVEVVDPLYVETLSTFCDTYARHKKQKNRESQDLGKVCAALPKPVVQFVDQTNGVALYSLGMIVAQSGDLSGYATHMRLWKRMGLAVIDGERQRKVSSDAPLAIRHGYDPQRRALMWNIENRIIMAQVRSVKEDTGRLSKKGKPIYKSTGESVAIGAYGKIYLDRKTFEMTRGISGMHAHNRAKRYMGKKFLADLWTVWRDHWFRDGRTVQKVAVPPHHYLEAAE